MKQNHITIIPKTGRTGARIESAIETEGVVCTLTERLERLSRSVRGGRIAGYIVRPLESVWFNSCPWSWFVSALVRETR
jgi:hypothetical protein